jgi:hypothetical protein
MSWLAEAGTRCSKKVSSGRWLLTVSAGVSFFILVLAYVKKGPEYSIDPQAMVTIITAVFLTYFNQRNGNTEK